MVLKPNVLPVKKRVKDMKRVEPIASQEDHMPPSDQQILRHKEVDIMKKSFSKREQNIIDDAEKVVDNLLAMKPGLTYGIASEILDEAKMLLQDFPIVRISSESK